MSANRELVERFYREVAGPGAFSDPRTIDAMAELLHEDVEMRQMSAVLDTAGLFQGYDGFIQAASELLNAFDGIWFEPERIVEQGDRVGVIALGHGTGRTSGIPLERRVAHLFEIRDGRIVSLVVRDDPESALSELGAP